MDSTLSIEDQVASVCRECYLGIRDISRVRKYLTEKATTHLIMALVTSKLEMICFTICHFSSTVVSSSLLNLFLNTDAVLPIYLLIF